MTRPWYWTKVSWTVGEHSTHEAIWPPVDREFANGPGDLGSIPVRVIPMTLKMVLDTVLLTLSNIRYVSRVKWSNPGKGVASSLTPWCSSCWKGSLRVTLDYGRQLYLTGSLAYWVECSPMVRETWVQSQVALYQRLLKWYFIPLCLTLINIRYVSRVKRSNPGKGVAPSPTCSSCWKGSLQVALDSGRQQLKKLIGNEEREREREYECHRWRHIFVLLSISTK